MDIHSQIFGSRSCKNPYKSDLIQERYEMPTACNDINTMIEVDDVCDINNPVNPPQGNIKDTMNDFVHKYAMENVAVIKLFVKDPYYTNNKRDVAITVTTFIGNAGGLMGLCLGLSFISLFEVVYHFLFACLRTIFSSNNQKQNSVKWIREECHMTSDILCQHVLVILQVFLAKKKIQYQYSVFK